MRKNSIIFSKRERDGGRTSDGRAVFGGFTEYNHDLRFSVRYIPDRGGYFVTSGSSNVITLTRLLPGNQFSL